MGNRYCCPKTKKDGDMTYDSTKHSKKSNKPLKLNSSSSRGPVYGAQEGSINASNLKLKENGGNSTEVNDNVE